MKKMRIMLLVMTAVIVLACGILPYEVTVTKKDSEQAGEQPTVTYTAIVINTNTPISTSTRTQVPTSTLAPSSTPNPTRTPIPTKTPTLTSTVIKTPTRTVYYCPQAAIGTPCP